ncbi:50S ribosomal protein L15 [Candidatus Woesebacteria bacterium]|nr:50S ribosomal protein L15 [Candidatus Woesebacteria bacterium]
MINALPKIVGKRPKRVGRGYGSGKGGHTSGRGQKGQKARSKTPILFEGYKTKKSLIRRLPMLRGKGKLTPKHPPVIINVSALDKLPAGSKVDIETLAKHGLVDPKRARKFGVKILGKGKIGKKLVVEVPMSHKPLKTLTQGSLKKKN